MSSAARVWKSQSLGAFAAAEFLSDDGDLRQAAARLFAALCRLDAQGIDRIVEEWVRETGLGLAIDDRPRRRGRIHREESGTNP